MKQSIRFSVPLAAVIVIFAAASAAQAAGKLTLYCSPQIEWCQLVIKEFQKATGIKVAMTRKSSGATLAPGEKGYLRTGRTRATRGTPSFTGNGPGPRASSMSARGH